MELVDDVWRRIFQLLPTFQRTTCTQVSKKWRGLVIQPQCWKTVEVSLLNKKTNIQSESESMEINLQRAIEMQMRATSFFTFFHKISSSIIDLNLELSPQHNTTYLTELLDSIFQIHSLERVRCNFKLLTDIPDAYVVSYETSSVPACKDLRVLNMDGCDINILAETHKVLLSGMPNLEEYYPSARISLAGMVYPDMLVHTPKLKRLSLIRIGFICDIKRYIDICPSLECIVLREEESLLESELDSLEVVSLNRLIRKYNNTYIIFSTIFDTLGTLSKDQLTVLKPLLTRYTDLNQPLLSCVVAQCTSFSKPVLEFFIKEMNYDPNAKDLPEFYYQPSFCFGGFDDKQYLPIETAILDPSKLKVLLELGADPNAPEISLISHTEDKDSALLLLQYGADPNKTVHIEEDYPAYIILLAFLLYKPSGQFALDPYLIIDELGKLGCDLNALYHGYSLLDHLLMKKFKMSVEVMLNHGVKWEWTKFACKFVTEHPSKFEDWVKSGKIDVKTMPVKLAVSLCRNNLGTLLLECFKANRDYQDENGTTLAHLVALVAPTDAKQKDQVKWKSLTKFDRWIVESPKPKITQATTPSFSFATSGSSSSAPKFNFSSAALTDNSGLTFSFTPSIIPPNPSSTFNVQPAQTEPLAPITPPSVLLPSSSVTPQTNAPSFSFTSSIPPPNPTFSFTPVTSDTTTNSDTNTETAIVTTTATLTTPNPTFSFTSSIPPPNPNAAFSFTSSLPSTDALTDSSPSDTSAPQPSTTSFSFTSHIPPPNPNAAFSFSSTSGSNASPAPSNAPQFSFTSSIAPPNPNGGAFSFTNNNSLSNATFNLSTSSTTDSQFDEIPPSFTFSTKKGGKLEKKTDVIAPFGGFSFLSSAKKYDWSRDFTEIFMKQVNMELNHSTYLGYTPLHSIVRTTIDRVVKAQRATLMLEHGADPTIKNSIGTSILSSACSCGVWEIVFLLLEKYNAEAQLNEKDQHGLTPLMHAVVGYKHNDNRPQDEFDVNFAQLLTKYMADLSLCDNLGRSLVHYLAALGKNDLLIPFIDKMDVNARDMSGFTPLHYAIMFGNDQLIEPLIKCGADVNAQTTSLKLTPLMLLLHITDPASPYYCYLYHYATMFFGSFAGMTDYIKGTPATAAHVSRARPFTTRQRNVTETIELLRSKSDLNVTDRFGNSVQQQIDYTAIVNPLAESDEQPMFINFLVKLFKDTHDQRDWLEELTKYLETKDDAIIHARDSNGNTPLHIACQFFHMGVVDSIFACLEDEHQSAPYCLVAFMLLKYGADPTAKNNKGETPLDYVPNLKDIPVKMKTSTLQFTKETIDRNEKFAAFSDAAFKF